jgi:hypothetical protein
LNASDYFLEMFLKVFRIPMNIWGPDFFVPNRAFKMVSALVSALIGVSLAVLPIAHFVLLFYSIKYSALTHGWSLLISAYVVMVLLPNLLGALVTALNSISFGFSFGRNSVPMEKTLQ